MAIATQSELDSVNLWSVQEVPDMTDAQFLDWTKLIESRTGMCLTKSRRTFVQTSLIMRMREIGISDYSEYLERIYSGPEGTIEWSVLVDRLTIQETRFFRDESAIDLVENYIRKNKTAYSANKPLSIWSFGCSTGEEPFSLAMSAAKVFANISSADWPFLVTATDISVPVLAKARKGLYQRHKLTSVDPNLLEKYFTPTENLVYQVSEEIKDRVCFSRVNALEVERAPMQQMDIIYCQNLLIYFRKWRRKEIVDQLAKRLKPGGLLVLGMGEVSDWRNELVAPIENDSVLAFVRKGEQAEAEVNC